MFKVQSSDLEVAARDAVSRQFFVKRIAAKAAQDAEAALLRLRIAQMRAIHQRAGAADLGPTC